MLKKTYLFVLSKNKGQQIEDISNIMERTFQNKLCHLVLRLWTDYLSLCF